MSLIEGRRHIDNNAMTHSCTRLRFLRLVGLAVAALTSAAAQEAPAAPKIAERAYAFRTSSGYYLTAENGGGASVNTDRTELGPWETFTIVQTAPGVFAFRTEDGHYLSDMMGDRRSRQNRGGLSATKKEIDSAAQFKLMVVNPEGPVVALMTSGGRYVTAEGSGGMKARSLRAMSSDRVDIGEWEQFTLVDVEKEKARKAAGN